MKDLVFASGRPLEELATSNPLNPITVYDESTQLNIIYNCIFSFFTLKVAYYPTILHLALYLTA